ncbi:MAG: hypothetical protein AABY16_01670, partial [Nanoarchaeota archaeon]
IPDISSSDIVDAEQSVDDQLKEQIGDVLVSAYPIVEYSTGWYESSDGRADLINMIIVRKEGTSNDGDEVFVSAHGKLHIGGSPFKIATIERSDSRVVYDLQGHQVSGKLVLEKVKSYNGGISRWDGALTLREEGDTTDSLTASVQLMTREKRIDDNKIKEYKEHIKSSYSGWLRVDQVTFKFQSIGNSNAKEIKAQVYGENNVQGKMELELVSDGNGVRVYEGRLKAEEIGDSDDRISLTLRAEVKNEGNQWSGPLRATLEDGYVVDGEMTIYEERIVRTTPVVDVPEDRPREDKPKDVKKDDSFDSDDTVEESSDDLSALSKGKKKGFWKKFFEAFGFGEDSA